MSIDFSDQDLLVRVRSGDTSAFGDLYARYSPVAHRAARRMVRDADMAEDLVSESFARVFRALRADQGPHGDLLPYLLVTMRNVAAAWGRESLRWTSVGDESVFEPRDPRDHGVAADEDPVDDLNLSLTRSAFETLRPRWRIVLWYLEVEGESASEVGARLGLPDGAVRQLARRAREGLRDAYLAAYLGGNRIVGAHVPVPDLVQMARGKISLRRRAAFESHLDTCPRCTRLLLEAAEENSTLRVLALPFYLAAVLAVLGFVHRIPWPQAKRFARARVRTRHLPMPHGVFAGVAVTAMTVTAVTGVFSIGSNHGHRAQRAGGLVAAVSALARPGGSPSASTGGTRAGGPTRVAPTAPSGTARSSSAPASGPGTSSATIPIPSRVPTIAPTSGPGSSPTITAPPSEGPSGTPTVTSTATPRPTGAPTTTRVAPTPSGTGAPPSATASGPQPGPGPGLTLTVLGSTTLVGITTLQFQVTNADPAGSAALTPQVSFELPVNDVLSVQTSGCLLSVGRLYVCVYSEPLAGQVTGAVHTILLAQVGISALVLPTLTVSAAA